MKCSRCGKEIDDNLVFCPFCGISTGKYNDVPQETKTKTVSKRKKIFKPFIIICIIVILLLSLVTKIPKTQVTSDSKETTASAIKTENKKENLQIGNIIKDNNLYIGISYIKSLNYYQTALEYYSEKIDSDNEVIYIFFDIYNSSSNTKLLSEEITAFADSKQVIKTNSNLYAGIDGYKEYSSYRLDPNTQTILLKSFEVKKGWNEIKIYYNSIYSWTVKPEDIKKEKFTGQSLYTNINYHKESTEMEKTIYNKDYCIKYCGFEVYDKKLAQKYDVKYAIFKFNIENKSDLPLNFDLSGKYMRAYKNNYLLPSAEHSTDKIGDYINFFDISTVPPEMSVNCYLAFEITSDSGEYCCVFDDGDIESHPIATVYSTN